MSQHGTIQSLDETDIYDYCHTNCWTVSSMVVLDSKSIADAMVCACRKLLRDLSGVKPLIYTAARIGGSLAPTRLTH